ncbi:Ca2+-dependent phosphoinositide-specific phospholipase C [Joostella sp. CR20]|uniref:Ca2+-dependent phosphoinositide-specific phospholipase C n=1 Tax=Joostella sp. CR20 TaxID=2804312 RepID=UPI00313CA0BB
MKINNIIIATFLFSGLVSTQAQEKEFSNIPKDLKINEIQVLGTHNSYSKPIDPRVLSYAGAAIDKMMPKFMANMPAEKMESFKENHPNDISFADGLNYEHPPFPEQLDAGLRNLEIDVFYDPEGGRFTQPAAYEFFKKQGITDLLPFNSEDLKKPGFKMMHIADMDFRTHYPTLKQGLEDLKKWSDSHPNHIPIFIQVEAKDSGMPLFPNATEVLPFTEEAFDALDKEFVDVLGRDKVITPDDIKGNYNTLKEAVLNKNWPTVDEARGKFIFLLLPSAGGIDRTSPYTNNRPNLEGRLMFMRSTEEDDFAAFFLLDNAIKRQEDIKKYVKLGYMVRTRSDIETYEAKINDYTRANAAFSSGAQVISTDFYKPGNPYKTPYYVQLPGGDVARCNPINAIDKCEK